MELVLCWPITPCMQSALGVLDKPSDRSLEKNFSLCQQLSVTNSFSVKGGTRCLLSLLVLVTFGHELLQVFLYMNSWMC